MFFFMYDSDFNVVCGVLNDKHPYLNIGALVGYKVCWGYRKYILARSILLGVGFKSI